MPNLVNQTLPNSEAFWMIPSIPREPPKNLEEEKKYEEILLQIADNEKVFNEAAYKRQCKLVTQKNAELHSMRCDLKLKLWVAEKFLNEDKLYFPHNLDFRGRAYPIPQNLNHMGGDLSRGLLSFGQGKALGPVGLIWLKIQLSDLFGYNKMSRDDRVKWTDENLHHVLDSANNPVIGNRWWSTAENPFQALAVCFEINNAMNCAEGHEAYVSYLPIHQDGSCNGLQHYAALGRDSHGGAAVNLVKNKVDKPADVYSEVLTIVQEHIRKEMQISPDEEDKGKRLKGEMARLVAPLVNRKVIKQTVMTSVYGVTRVGARLQVEKQLEGLLYGDQTKTPEMDTNLFQASRYTFNLILIVVK